MGLLRSQWIGPICRYPASGPCPDVAAPGSNRSGGAVPHRLLLRARAQAGQRVRPARDRRRGAVPGRLRRRGGLLVACPPDPAAAGCPGSCSQRRPAAGASARWSGPTTRSGVQRSAPFPSLADVGYLLFPVFALAALLVRPSAAFDGKGRVRVLLDGLMVAGALFNLSWATTLGEVYHQGADSVSGAGGRDGLPGRGPDRAVRGRHGARACQGPDGTAAGQRRDRGDGRRRQRLRLPHGDRLVQHRQSGRHRLGGRVPADRTCGGPRHRFHRGTDGVADLLAALPRTPVRSGHPRHQRGRRCRARRRGRPGHRRRGAASSWRRC